MSVAEEPVAYGRCPVPDLLAYLQSETELTRSTLVHKRNGQALYLVRETKGTRDFLKLRTGEADKIRCGQQHFEVLGVPFAVAVSADEV